MIKNIKLKNGLIMPKLGIGSWYMGEDVNLHNEEINSIRKAITNGMTLIDTAEMYGAGLSEKLIGEAIECFERENLFIVSKFYPYNASRNTIFNALEKSLERLGVLYLDLYLYHWRGVVPLRETVECLEELVSLGKIKSWGVSNFDVADMDELFKVKNGSNCVVNQVLYHLGSRGIERYLLPWMEEHNVVCMAYSPMGHKNYIREKIVSSNLVKDIASKHHVSPFVIMLNFVLRNNIVIAIPKSSSVTHTLDNAKVLDFELTNDEYDLLNKEFPAPTNKVPLDIL